MDRATREAKAGQLAALMNELGAYVWKGVIHVDEDQAGMRVVLTEDYTWQYREGKTKKAS
jgi:hypothetical protein